MQLLSFCFYLCVLCVQLPIWLGIGTIALPSCPSQDRDSRPPPGSSAHRDKHWFPLQLAFCLEAKWKCISRDLWSKQTKQPVLQIPVGIFPHGRRETSVKSQGWISEGSEGEGRLRLAGLEAVPDTAASPKLTQTLWAESLGAGCQGGTSHPCLFQSSLSQIGHT